MGALAMRARRRAALRLVQKLCATHWFAGLPAEVLLLADTYTCIMRLHMVGVAMVMLWQARVVTVLPLRAFFLLC